MLRSASCQDVVWEGTDVDLARLPIQHCWPGDVAPLITWGLVITRGPLKTRQNLGIYRQQVLNRNQVIMRWLAHRGGALDFRDHGLQNPGQPYPVAVAIGADPATNTPNPFTERRVAHKATRLFCISVENAREVEIDFALVEIIKKFVVVVEAGGKGNANEAPVPRLELEERVVFRV